MTSHLALRPHERRAEPRLPASAPGRVWYGRNLELWADCKLKNLSRGGAKIEIPALYQLPSRLVLIHKADAAVFEAIVKWRQGDAVGLSFERRQPLETCDEARLQPIVEAWRALMGV